MKLRRPAQTIIRFQANQAFAWPLVRMSEVVTLHYGKALTVGNRRLGTIPVYGTNGPTGWHNIALGLGPTVVLGRKGMGNLGVEWCEGPFWVIDTAYYTSFRHDLFPKFFYYFTNFIGLNHLKDGTSNPSLSRDTFGRQLLPLPPLDEQQRIAALLSELDDKIELNRKMNETLETMARAIFKSWFVEFDPVRAKGEGRQPFGMDADTAALFPNAFQDSPLGKIPKGWQVCKLADLCATQYGFTASAADDPVGPKFLRVTDINKRHWIEWDSVPYCTIAEGEKAQYALSVGDIVVARMADPGKSAIVEEPVDAIFASYLVRLKAQSLALAYYIYGFLKSSAYAEYSEGAKGGSVQASMNARVIVEAETLVPRPDILDAFLGRILPLRRRIVANVQQNSTLAVVRDALLPKLISGEIRVKDAQKILE